MIKCSLNEIDTLAHKAALGAGMCWGLAEETGKALRYLASYGLPGFVALADLLNQNDGKSYHQLAPLASGAVWQAADKAADNPLCPLIAGITLCDHAQQLFKQDQCQFDNISYPLLLIPFAARIATTYAIPLSVSWAGVELFFSADNKLYLSTDESLLTVANIDALSVKFHNNSTLVTTGLIEQQKLDSEVMLSDSSWRALQVFAQRTYVPASAASRAKGAGSGTKLTDND